MVNKNKKPLEIKVLRDWGCFDGLKFIWQKLLHQSDADNIFLTWEWIDCWRKIQGADIKPLIIVIQDRDQILAIAPFYIQKYRLVHLQIYQALRFLGDHSSGSEYSNFIVKKEKSVELKSMLWTYLLSSAVKPYWDFIWFTNVSSWTNGGQTLLQSLADVNALNYYSRGVEFAQVKINQLPADILPCLSKSLRTNIRQTSRHLDKKGPWRMAVCAEAAEIKRHLEQLFLLHNKHWQNAGGGTFQRRPELTDFYRYFVPLALEKGWLRLFRLESKGEIKAMQLGYVYNNRFLAIQEGYDPDFIGGVGQVLRHFSYQECQKESVSCYDFLGVYTDHKRRWKADKKLGENLFIWHNTAKNLPFKFKKIWPTGGYLKPID